MKLFIALKERCQLQRALRVKVVFNRVNFEWLVTVELTSVLQNLCIKFPLKKYRARTWRLKKNPAGLEE